MSSTSGSPIQATIPGAETLERVRTLMESPLFNRTNPNRMRALVGTFAFANPTGFGRADGEGYRFLAGQILDIDERNPQLAARILTSMRSWRSLESVRADHARCGAARDRAIAPLFRPTFAISSSARSRGDLLRPAVAKDAAAICACDSKCPGKIRAIINS